MISGNNFRISWAKRKVNSGFGGRIASWFGQGQGHGHDDETFDRRNFRVASMSSGMTSGIRRIPERRRLKSSDSEGFEVFLHLIKAGYGHNRDADKGVVEDPANGSSEGRLADTLRGVGAR